MRPRAAVAAAVVGCLGLGGCRPSEERNDLGSLRTDNVVIKGHTFHVWMAETVEQQRLGLMNVAAEELPADWGMLFVFPEDRVLSFWMKNTIIPLDIAFIGTGGVIVKTHTMPPQTLQGFGSGSPAQFALEVNAGRFAELGIAAGDAVLLPESVGGGG